MNELVSRADSFPFQNYSGKFSRSITHRQFEVIHYKNCMHRDVITWSLPLLDIIFKYFSL